MARNSRSALYINDPVKIVAGVFTVRQALYVAGIVLLTYILINATSHLPYGQSGLGQVHLLLIVGLPALLTLLIVTFAGSGTVEPYARQIAGYLWRLLRATPRRLSYRATRLVTGRHRAPVVGARAGDGEAAGSTGTGYTIALDSTATHASVRALAPTPAPLVAVTPLMATPLAQAQRARLHAWLAAHPGATNEEIAAGADLTPAAVRPRRRELEAAGVVRKVDLEGRTRAGRRAARWEVVGTVGTVGTPGEMAHG